MTCHAGQTHSLLIVPLLLALFTACSDQPAPSSVDLPDESVVRGDTSWIAYVEAGVNLLPYDAVPTDRDGALIGGEWRSEDATSGGFLLQVDSLGQELWYRETTHPIRSLIPSDMGGYVSVGHTTDSSGIGIGRFDDEGEELWQRELTGEVGYWLYEDAGGDFVIAGRSPEGAVLVGANANGDETWREVVRTRGSDKLMCVVPDGENGYVATGSHVIGSSVTSDLLLVRLAGDGETVWEQSYGGGRSESGSFLLRLPGTGYLVTGRGYRSSGSGNAWAFLVDEQGDMLWEVFTGSGGLAEYSHALEDYGSFVTTGTDESGQGDMNTILSKISGAGTLLWHRDLGLPLQVDGGNAVLAMSDGGYLVVARGYKMPGDALRDVYLIKTYSNGTLDTSPGA